VHAQFIYRQSGNINLFPRVNELNMQAILQCTYTDCQRTMVVVFGRYFCKLAYMCSSPVERIHFICISQTPVCCPGYYGGKCSLCPGGYKSPCSGKGQVSRPFGISDTNCKLYTVKSGYNEHVYMYNALCVIDGTM
jgi:hypothetical protein